MKKFCSRCKEEKDTEKFRRHKNTKDGLNCWCKDCEKEYNKEYREKNKIKLKEKSQKYYQENISKIKKRVSEYQKSDKGKKIKRKSNARYRKSDKAKNVRKRWIDKNRDKLNENRRKNYDKRKLNHNVSQAIRDSIRENKNGKHWEELVDFTLDELKEHLEKQFKEGMSWDNYGRYGWHIDHIKPVSSFNVNSYEDEEFKECWCLENLQPLWAEENLKKGSKWKGGNNCD